MWTLRLLLILAATIWAAPAATGGSVAAATMAGGAPAAEVVVGEAVARGIAAYGSARVVVLLRVGAPRGVTAGLPGAAGRRAADAAQERALAGLAPRDFEVAHRYTHVPALAGRLTARGLAALRANPAVERIDVDEVGYGALAQTVPLIRADVTHAAHGLSGAGVTVAVLDSGLDRDHPDLADALVAEQCFCNFGVPCCPNGQATQSGAGAAEDDNGHGSNVTGILLGNGAVASVGVAPGASLVAIKVLSAHNLGSLSDWAAALDWILASRPDVRIVNMSLCSLETFPGLCTTGTAPVVALRIAVEMLAATGVTIVAASCNGAATEGMAAPACFRDTIAVGAVDDQDEVASFSNSSEALDLLAPGVDVIAAWLFGFTASYTGTSMATPHVAGAAALLLEAQPALTPRGLRQALAGTGVERRDPRNGRLRPRIDTEEAYLKVANCGDGIRTGPREQCDDGNTADGDGCSSACDLECPPAPLAGCRQPAVSGKAQLVLKDKSRDRADGLVWKWVRGATTHKSEFGDPLATDSVRVCLYDATGPRMSLTAPAGGACRGAPCWGEKPSGFAYKDKDLTPDGLFRLTFKEGAAPGEAKITVKGKGPALEVPDLADLASPVTVQLQASTGACWEAVYSAPFLRQERDQFKDRAD